MLLLEPVSFMDTIPLDKQPHVSPGALRGERGSFYVSNEFVTSRTRPSYRDEKASSKDRIVSNLRSLTGTPTTGIHIYIGVYLQKVLEWGGFPSWKTYRAISSVGVFLSGME